MPELGGLGYLVTTLYLDTRIGILRLATRLLKSDGSNLLGSATGLGSNNPLLGYS